jgi:outer membrane cobalamin receptor
LETTAGGYSTLSLHAAYQATERITGFLRIDNLFNAHYHQFVGFPDPGIYVRAGMTFHALGRARSASGSTP